MKRKIYKALLLAQFMAQSLSMALIIVFAIILSVLTLLSAFGVIPWLQVSAHFEEYTYNNAGKILQITLTALSVMLAFLVPSTQRVMRLERSHRRFNVDMQDIANAYTAVHAADRAGNFRLSSEFDEMRDRMAYLRDHPDLAGLEPALLKVAADMSFVSKELAETYSNENIERARTFLRQREHEITQFQDRLQKAKAINNELHTWVKKLELEESGARNQLAYLHEELREVMPEVVKEVTDEKAAKKASASNPPQLSKK